MSLESRPTADRGGPSAPVVFGALLFTLLVSTTASVLVFAGIGRTPAESDATPTPAVTLVSTPVDATAPAATGANVRVLNASGSSTPAEDGRHVISFTWALQGANENDEVALLIYAGNDLLGEQRGALDPSVFSFSTGRFTVTAELPCSPGGWSAVITTIRGLPIEGDSEAEIPGPSC